MAHQHILSYLVPYNGEKVIKNVSYLGPMQHLYTSFAVAPITVSEISKKTTDVKIHIFSNKR